MVRQGEEFLAYLGKSQKEKPELDIEDTEDTETFLSRRSKGYEYPILEEKKIGQLKYKCSVTLLSLLEARKDNTNVLRMMKTLHSEVLNNNLTEVYVHYQIQHNGTYTQDIFLVISL